MIPKIIHYVWFGKKKKKTLIRRCIKSWRKNCPDYKIILWDENSFDFNLCRYAKEAYERKSWAFLSDFIRLYALREYGGIYLDTDVELFKTFDQLLDKKAFVGFEDEKTIGTAIIGSEPHNELIENLYKIYEQKRFIMDDNSVDLTPNVQLLTKKLCEIGLQRNNTFQNFDNIMVYPSDYFYPKSYITSKTVITENTICIHHCLGSWCTKKSKLIKFLGPGITKFLVRIKHLFK